MCHGWSGYGGGREHLNSAKNIRCGPNNELLYDQYAGSLDCSGTGRSKSYTFTCTQGTPPAIYDLLTDNSCCTGTSNECKFIVPYARSPGATNQKTYLNGIICDDLRSTEIPGSASLCGLVNSILFVLAVVTIVLVYV
jgi:hypothetical protein